MKIKDIQAIKDKRYTPLTYKELAQVSRAIKKDAQLANEYGLMVGEFALRVSLQLQQYERLNELEKRYQAERNKSDGDLLREIADRLDWYE